MRQKLNDAGLKPDENVRDLPRPFEIRKVCDGNFIDWGTHKTLNLSLRPGVAGETGPQFEGLLSRLKRHALQNGVSLSNTVQITAFAPSDDFESSKKEYEKMLAKAFKGLENVPPTSIVGQNPLDGANAGLEAVLLSQKSGKELIVNPSPSGQGVVKTLTESQVEELSGQNPGSLSGSGDTRYCTAISGDAKWVFSAGLCGKKGSSDASDNARVALAKQMAILCQEGIFDPEAKKNRGLVNSHHYLDDIVGPNYNRLNVERDRMYTRFGVDSFPSATGIGMSTRQGDVIMELTATDAEYEPVIVSQHGEAYQYKKEWLKGQSIGKKMGEQGAGKSVSVPMFSRAVYIPKSGVMIISGTASVEKGRGPMYLPDHFESEKRQKGKVEVDVTDIADSVGIERLRATGFGLLADDKSRINLSVESAAQAQTLVTIRNMARLLKARGMSLKDLALARVYVTKPEDEKQIRRITEPLFKNTPCQSVRGPVCYDDWLVEIEGIAAKSKAPVYKTPDH